MRLPYPVITWAHEDRLIRSPVTNPGKNIPTACNDIVLAIVLYSIPRSLIANGVEVMTKTIAK